MTWKQKYLGIIGLPSHVKWYHMTSYYIVSMVTISLFVFINAAQPFILQTYLRIPQSEQGHVSGDLAFCNELVILLCAYVWGYLSDVTHSRKLIYILGFLFMSIGLGLYPLAPSIIVLFVFRVLFAIGAASASSMLTAVLADYTIDGDRGKATGLLGVMSGLGAVIAAICFLKLPSIFHKYTGERESGYLTYSLIALLSAIMCFVSLFGLYGPLVHWKPQQPQQQDQSQEEEDQQQVWTSQQQTRKSPMVILKEGIVAARDPLVLLSYIASFVARGDSVLITTFISLWVSQSMIDQHDASKAEAIAKAGMISGIAQTCALMAAPFVGILSDRVNHVGTLIVVSIISGVGYSTTYFLKDVTRGLVYLPICLIGIGEIGVIICSQILVTQCAPEQVRGSVSGVFTLFGAAGILMTTKVGGILYDRWRPSGPFVLLGLFNFLLAALALALYVIHLVIKRRGGSGILKSMESKQQQEEEEDEQVTVEEGDEEEQEQLNI